VRQECVRKSTVRKQLRLRVRACFKSQSSLANEATRHAKQQNKQTPRAVPFRSSGIDDGSTYSKTNKKAKLKRDELQSPHFMLTKQ